MSKVKAVNDSFAPPPLHPNARGEIERASLANVIQWFLDYDQRVSVIKHQAVEELFRWKQEEDKRELVNLYPFDRAEDRLAVGIFQALTLHNTEAALNDWIGQLLGAIAESSKINEAISTQYNLDMTAEASAVREAAKIATQQEQVLFLTSCWRETLCTAEARMLSAGSISNSTTGRFILRTFN